MRKLDAYFIYLFFEGMVSFSLSVIFTLNMVYQVETAGLSALQLVLVGTALEVSVFLFEVPTGVVADTYSRRLSIIIGAFIMGLGFLLEGSLPVFLAIAAGQALWGLGFTFTSGATQAWITDEIGEAAAGKAFLRASQVGAIGALAGIPVSVALGSARLNLPILAGGVFLILVGLFLALFMPETGFSPAPKEARESWKSMFATFRDGLHLVRGRSSLITLLVIGLFFGLYSEAYDRLWTKHILDTFNMPAFAGLDSVAWFGILRAVGIGLSLGAAEIAHRRIDTDSPGVLSRALFGLTAVLVASLVLFSNVGSLALVFVLFWAVSVSRGLIGPLYTAWVNRRLDSRVRATVLSMSSQVDAIGQIAGGPILGAVGNLSVRAAITLSGLVLSPVLALFGRAARQSSLPAAEISEA